MLDSLPKPWNPQIDKAEKETPEMGEVSHAPSRSTSGKVEKFKSSINHDKVFSRDGEEIIDIDWAAGKGPAESQK